MIKTVIKLTFVVKSTIVIKLTFVVESTIVIKLTFVVKSTIVIKLTLQITGRRVRRGGRGRIFGRVDLQLDLYGRRFQRWRRR